MFEVEDHFELPSRGVCIAGRILGGVWRSGAEIVSPVSRRVYRIKGVEMLDNISTRMHKQVLMLGGTHQLGEVQREFPSGSQIAPPAP